MDRSGYGKSRGGAENGHRRRTRRPASRGTQRSVRTRACGRPRGRARRNPRAGGSAGRHVLRLGPAVRSAGCRGGARTFDPGHGSGATNRAPRTQNRSHADHRHHSRSHCRAAGGGPRGARASASRGCGGGARAPGAHGERARLGHRRGSCHGTRWMPDHFRHLAYRCASGEPRRRHLERTVGQRTSSRQAGSRSGAGS